MVHVYVLENNKGKHYVGITFLLLEKRLKKHNEGGVFSTKSFRPWKILYCEDFLDYKSARAKEKKIKGWKGGNAFKKFIASAAGSSNGRTRDSESRYLGPNPSPAALAIRKFGGGK